MNKELEMHKSRLTIAKNVFLKSNMRDRKAFHAMHRSQLIAADLEEMSTYIQVRIILE